MSKLLSVPCLMVVLSVLWVSCKSPVNKKARSDILPVSVLLVSIDTLRADHLGCYGYPRATSPEIDRMSRNCVLFSQAVANDSNTTPSHMSLFTSIYPSVHRVGQYNKHRLRLGKGIPTIGSILKKAGYATAAFTGGGNVSPEFGFDRGFDRYEVRDPMSGSKDVAYLKDVVLSWITKSIVEQTPSFCFLHTYQVHDPYFPPGIFNKLFDPDYKGKIITSANQIADYNAMAFDKRRKAFWKSVDKKSERDVEHVKALYDGSIRYVDMLLHYFLSSLQAAFPQWKRLLILTSDHGEEFLEHKRFLHTNTLFEELIRVPLIVNLPDNTMKGLIKTEPVELVDILPTITDLLGIKNQPAYQGHSLFKLASAKGNSGLTFSVNMRKILIKSAVRTRDWKYIRSMVRNREQLFHLSLDPYETKNLAKDPAHQVIKKRLQEMIRAQWKENEKLRRTIPGPEEAKVANETKQQLKALGYIH